MRAKPGLLIAVALVCGLIAMYGANQILSKPSPSAPEMRAVLVATRDLNLEEVIREDMLVVDKLPAARLPAGTYDDAKGMLGRWVQVKMFAGEPIVDAKLAPKGTPEGMVSRIPAGMRALAVEVNEQTGVSGFIQPEHHVDVILNKTNNVPGSPQAETILQDMLVLAAGKVMTRTDDKTIDVRSVTLAVTPEQADELSAARSHGTLSLSLRGFADHSKVARPAPPKPETIPVVVALRDLAPREAIRAGMVDVRQMAKAKVPADAKSDPGAIEGRTLANAVAAGSPITEAGLSPRVAEAVAVAKPEPQPDFGSRIGPGMRAFILMDEEQAGLAGFLNGDSRVDVLFTRAAAGGAAAPPEAEPVVQDARVLVMAPRDGPSGDGAAPKGPMALEVPLAEALRLTAARAAGKLSLTLRGADDGGRWVSERPTVTIYRGPPGRGTRMEVITRGPASGRYDRRAGGLAGTTAARGELPGSRRPD